MMKIQEKVLIREVFYHLAFVVLLLVAPYGESKKEEQESFLVYMVDSGEINQKMVDLFRGYCKVEFLQIKRILQDIELFSTVDGSSESEELWNGRPSRKKIHEIGNVFLPLVKQLFQDCSRENNFMFPETGEDVGSENWYSKYLGFLFSQRSSSRRRKLAETLGEAPAPSPSFLSPGPAPTIYVAPDPDVSESPSKLPVFPPVIKGANLQPTAGVKDQKSSKQKTSKRTVVIAVVVTASMTFLISALLFFCWRRYGTGSGQGRNDERPLLSLSLRDYSIASPYKPFDLGTSMNEEKLGNQSFDNKLNHGQVGDKSYMESHSLGNLKMENSAKLNAGAATNAAEYPVVKPLGAMGFPPLKRPPGRTDHFKPTLGDSTPTPTHKLATAPVPPPPPLVRPLSGVPHAPPPGTPLPPPIPSGIKTGPRPPPPPPPRAGPHAPAPPPSPTPLGAGPRPPPPPGSGVPPPRPPPPGSGVPPPRPPPSGLKPPRPVSSHPSTTTSTDEGEADGPKAKLKPFFWDKVLANPDHSMVWHQIKSGSFQFNEEMIESLFGYAPAVTKMNGGKKETSSQDLVTHYIQIIDPKKSQNLAILLKALNLTTEEVCDALEEGNELPAELIQTLLKMAPTTEEELKLRLYNGNISQLGPAERFLKVLVDIPFAFKRLESLLLMCTLQEETSMLKDAFRVLEAASTELRKSRLFLKLLEAVLKTGNRMNVGTVRGDAQAFKLDTLLKLADVKGTDGKTTLLHFVVQEIIRSEGIRAARGSSSFKSDSAFENPNQDSDDHFRLIGLQVVSNLDSELENVKKAAILDADTLTGMVCKLGDMLLKSRHFLDSEMKNVSEENGFHQTLKSFVQNAEVDVMWLLQEEKQITALVKSTTDYFHGSAGKDEGLRLFVIVRDFLIILEKVCKELLNAPKKSSIPSKKDDTVTTLTDGRQTASDPRQRLFPAITDRRIDSSSSDDEP